MCFCMRRQRALDGKRLVAVITFVRLFMCVYANMPHNVTRLLKFLFTVDTSVPLYAIHLPYSTYNPYIRSFCVTNNNHYTAIMHVHLY